MGKKPMSNPDHYWQKAGTVKGQINAHKRGKFRLPRNSNPAGTKLPSRWRNAFRGNYR